MGPMDFSGNRRAAECVELCARVPSTLGRGDGSPVRRDQPALLGGMACQGESRVDGRTLPFDGRADRAVLGR